MGEEEIHQLIKGCAEQDQKCQKMLYKAFYGYSMSICLRYTNDREEAAEVMNQGFFKVFINILKFDRSRPFKAWLGRIMMNASIDHYRSNLKTAYHEDLDQAEQVSGGNLSDANLNYEDLLAMVRTLPQAYRTVFNLFAIDGYSHEEIADLLNISVGTSKSNLHKARQKLKAMVLKANETGNTYYDKESDYPSIAAISNLDGHNDLFKNSIRR